MTCGLISVAAPLITPQHPSIYLADDLEAPETPFHGGVEEN
jgi:hypothetical protein